MEGTALASVCGEAGGHPPCPGPSWASLHFILGEQRDEMPHPVSSSGVQRKPEPRAERDGPGVFAEGELGSQRGAGPGAPLWAKGAWPPSGEGLGDVNTSPKPG